MPSLGSKTREELEAARERIASKAPDARKRLDERKARLAKKKKAKAPTQQGPQMDMKGGY